MFQIDKKVSLPASSRSGPKGASKYPFEVMSIGDSFLVPLNGQHPTVVQSRVLGASRHAKAKGRDFISRRVDDGIRIWRTA